MYTFLRTVAREWNSLPNKDRYVNIVDDFNA